MKDGEDKCITAVSALKDCASSLLPPLRLATGAQEVEIEANIPFHFCFFFLMGRKRFQILSMMITFLISFLFRNEVKFI